MQNHVGDNKHVNFAGVTGGITMPIITFNGQNAITGWGNVWGGLNQYYARRLLLRPQRLHGINRSSMARRKHCGHNRHDEDCQYTSAEGDGVYRRRLVKNAAEPAQSGQ